MLTTESRIIGRSGLQGPGFGKKASWSMVGDRDGERSCGMSGMGKGLSFGLLRDGGRSVSSLTGKMGRCDCRAAQEGTVWGKTEKVEASTGGGATASGCAGVASCGPSLLTLLTIEAASELRSDPDGVGTRSIFFSSSTGNCSRGRYEGGDRKSVV